MTRLAILWTNLSGYSAACWRRLADRPDVELCILTLDAGRAVQHTAFQVSLAQGLPIEPHDPATLDAAAVSARLEAFAPDAILMVGWVFEPYVQAALRHADATGSRLILTMDNPWQNTWRQWVTCLRRRRLAQRADLMLVAGARSLQFARQLGVPWEKLHVGMYGYDDAACTPQPIPDRPPPRLLFVGRYVEEKGVADLLQAYALYRTACEHAGEEPFGLTCHGSGPLADRIQQSPGVTDGGFIQPGELPEALARSAALVLPSHHEHWGVVVAEALACARPVICTQTTGSAAELIRDRYNGWLVPAHAPPALAHAWRQLHRDPASWRSMAERAPDLAQPFSATRWADLLQRLLHQPDAPPSGAANVGA